MGVEMNPQKHKAIEIREINYSRNELNTSLRVITESFSTVASELGLSSENCPTHPAFMTWARLQETLEKKVNLFGLFSGELQVGLVAVEKSTDEVFFLERLSVLPDYRHQGYGKRLIDYAFNFVKAQGGKVIKIALINEHSILKQWYLDYGFIETGTKNFPHLPFTVCFMEKEV